MTTANREYEALTTVEAVQKAFADGRAVECSYGTEAWRIVRPKDDGYDAAYFISKGVQYRAPAASVGDAPSDAVGAWFPAYVVHEMMQMAYRAALPPAGSQLRCANQIEAADTILAMEANRAILTAPPAAPVVSDAPPIPAHLIGQCESLVWAAAWELSAKHHVALSVPATDDKAPAVDAGDWPDYLMLRDTKLHDDTGVLGQRIFTTAGAGYEKRKYVRADLAAPTSPHDVDAGEKAPRHNLPTWGECADRVANSDYVAKRKAEGGYGEDPDGMYANALHRFIYEYDDADKFKSGWFMYRLQLVVDELTSRPHDVDAVRVDEAMVERALAAHAAEPKEYQHEIDYRVYQRDAMRAALTAALRKPGEA